MPNRTVSADSRRRSAFLYKLWHKAHKFGKRFSVFERACEKKCIKSSENHIILSAAQDNGKLSVPALTQLTGFFCFVMIQMKKARA